MNCLLMHNQRLPQEHKCRQQFHGLPSSATHPPTRKSGPPSPSGVPAFPPKPGKNQTNPPTHPQTPPQYSINQPRSNGLIEPYDIIGVKSNGRNQTHHRPAQHSAPPVARPRAPPPCKIDLQHLHITEAEAQRHPPGTPISLSYLCPQAVSEAPNNKLQIS